MQCDINPAFPIGEFISRKWHGIWFWDVSEHRLKLSRRTHGTIRQTVAIPLISYSLSIWQGVLSGMWFRVRENSPAGNRWVLAVTVFRDGSYPEKKALSMQFLRALWKESVLPLRMRSAPQLINHQMSQIIYWHLAEKAVFSISSTSTSLRLRRYGVVYQMMCKSPPFVTG